MFNKQEISNGNKKVQSREINQKEKVDINILLNRVREDRKKEKIIINYSIPYFINMASSFHQKQQQKK